MRRTHALGHGSLEWLDGYGDDVIAFRNGDVTVIANVGSTPVALPKGTLLVESDAFLGRELPADTTVWIAAD